MHMFAFTNITTWTRGRGQFVGASAAILLSLASIAGSASASVSEPAVVTPRVSHVANEPPQPTVPMHRLLGATHKTVRGTRQRHRKVAHASTSYDYNLIQTDSSCLAFGLNS